MAIASFEELCKGFCEIAGMDVPPLACDGDGAVAFSVRLRNVAVTVMEIAPVRPEVAYLLAELGTMPADIARQGWRVLMEANLHLQGDGCAAFSRRPGTSEAVLQRSMPFASATASGLYAEVSKMAELALQWRDDPLFGQPS